MNARTAAAAVFCFAVVVVAVAAPDASADNKPPSAPTYAPKTCGQGVCKRTVNAPVCTPGAPIAENDGWLAKADHATSSWDANCDGTVEKEQRDLSEYKIGCQMVRGNCVTRSGPFECGDDAPLWSKCELATKPDGTKHCDSGTLKGSFVQRCR